MSPRAPAKPTKPTKPAKRAKAAKSTQVAKPMKVPRFIKCPWDIADGIASSADGKRVVVAGELGQLSGLDVETWTLVPWPPVEQHGLVNSIAVSPDGAVTAVATAGDRVGIELRDATGAIQGFISTRRNARPSWSPTGDLMIARLEPDVQHETEQLAFVDSAKRTCTPIDAGAFDSAAACFVDGGDAVLAFVRRTDIEEHREQHRILKITRTGKVRDLGATEFWDSFAGMTPVGPDAVLVRGYNFGWRLVRTADAKVLARGDRRPAIVACAHAEGFAVVPGIAPRVACYSPKGRLVATKTAKARVTGVAVGGGHLLAHENGRPARIELLPL